MLRCAPYAYGPTLFVVTRRVPLVFCDEHRGCVVSVVQGVAVMCVVTSTRAHTP
jgi:hypothetical protein